MCRHLYLADPTFFDESQMIRWLESLENSSGGHGNGIGFFAPYDQLPKLMNDGFKVWSVGGELVRAIKKGLRYTPTQAARDIIRYADTAHNGILFHTRLSSSGTISDNLCHPFDSGENSILCHNGHWVNYETFKIVTERISDIEYPAVVSDTLVLAKILGSVPLKKLEWELYGDSIFKLYPRGVEILTGGNYTKLKALYGKTNKGFKVLAIASEIPRIFGTTGLHVYKFQDNDHHDFFGDLTKRFDSLEVVKSGFDVETQSSWIWYAREEEKYRYAQTSNIKTKKKKKQSRVRKFFKRLKKRKRIDTLFQEQESVKTDGYKTVIHATNAADPEVRIEVPGDLGLYSDSNKSMSTVRASKILDVCVDLLPKYENDSIDDSLYALDWNNLLDLVCSTCTRINCGVCQVYNSSDTHLRDIIERRLYRALEVMDLYRRYAG